MPPGFLNEYNSCLFYLSLPKIDSNNFWGTSHRHQQVYSCIITEGMLKFMHETFFLKLFLASHPYLKILISRWFYHLLGLLYLSIQKCSVTFLVSSLACRSYVLAKRPRSVTHASQLFSSGEKVWSVCTSLKDSDWHPRYSVPDE